MPKKFDATLKAILEESPEDWPELAGLPRQPADVIDADVSTISGAADKVLRVRGKTPFILHVELQSGRDESLARRIHVYNAILEHRHELPVISLVMLVCPQADHPNLTGKYERGLPAESPYLAFRYQAIRVWREKPERFLSAGRGLLPFAPISAVSKSDVPGIVERMKERLDVEQPHIGNLWTATNVLMGLRYKPSFVEHVLEGVLGMKESSTYQAIKREGRREGLHQGAIAALRKVVLRLGRRRFGPETPAVTDGLRAISQPERLEELAEAVVAAHSWKELLESQPAHPGEPKRRRRRTNGKPKS